MKQLLLIALLGASFTACQNSEDLPVQKKFATESLPRVHTDWVILFNGEDLSGFRKIGDANWQIVDDYVESNDAQGSFLVTRDDYSDFHLQLEFWPTPDANSGVFLRCQDPAVIANETCYELNIYDQHSNPDNATGSIINLAAPLVSIKAGNQWNTYDITARGSHIVVRLNDTLVVDLKDERFTEGPIGLQSNGGLIRFRNVKVKAL